MVDLYCGTLDVYYSGQVRYNQFKSIFTTEVIYNNWILGTLIPQAMAVVDEYVSHNFQSNSGTLLLDGNGKPWLPMTREGVVDDGSGYLPMEILPVPLITVDSVTDNGTAVTDYKTYHSYIKNDDGVFQNDYQNVKIIGTWGYTSVPNDIQYVTSRMCANVLGEMLRMRNIPDIIKSIMDGSGGLAPLFYNPVIMTKNEKELLIKYRYKEVQMA